MMTIEDYLEKPYWVIDILPKQVAENSRGQYFEIEKYYLEQPQMDIIYRKFVNIVLKLNCYEDIHVSPDGEEWMMNPSPHEMEAKLLNCLTEKSMLYIHLPSADTMITISGDDSYMTVYHPSEEVLELLKSLTTSEGLFIWKPESSNAII
jgi:hypothetical protein